jgi:hypothetical protein
MWIRETGWPVPAPSVVTHGSCWGLCCCSVSDTCSTHWACWMPCFWVTGSKMPQSFCCASWICFESSSGHLSQTLAFKVGVSWCAKFCYWYPACCRRGTVISIEEFWEMWQEMVGACLKVLFWHMFQLSRGKVVPVCAMKAYSGSISITVLILKWH